MDFAELKVILKADRSEYSNNIKAAIAEIKEFGTGVEKAVSGVTQNLAGLYALREAFNFTTEINKSIAQFAIMSRAVGIAADQLSQLTYAAKLQGLDDIDAPLIKLARSAGSVAEGNQKAAEAYKAIGVQVTDLHGKLKTTQQLFYDTADAFQKYGDGIAKIRVAQELFGRSDPTFIALLDEGSKKIKAAQQEAIDLGVAVTTPTAIAAHEFEENLTRMGAAFHGLFNRALEELLPNLIKLTDEIVEFSKGADKTSGAVNTLVVGFKGVETALILFGTAIDITGHALGGFIALCELTFEALLALGKATVDPLGGLHDLYDIAKRAGTVLKESFDDIAKAGDAGSKSIQDSLHVATQAEINWGKASADANELALQGKKDIIFTDKELVKGLESALEALAKFDDKLKEEVATYGLSAGAAQVYDLTLGKLSASVDELNKKPPAAAITALENLEKAGKLSQTQLLAIKEAMNKGEAAGDAYRDVILEDVAALDRLRAVDALTKLDTQILQITGHFKEAAQAAYDLSQRPLKIQIAAQADAPIKALEGNARLVEIGKQVTAAFAAANEEQAKLAQNIKAIDAAGQAAHKNESVIAGEEAAARNQSLSKIRDQFDAIVALAQATGDKGAAHAAEQLRDRINEIEFDPKVLADFEKLRLALADLDDKLKDQKAIEDAAGEQFNALNTARNQGLLTSIELMNRQDAAIDNEISQLSKLLDQLKQTDAYKIGNDKALEAAHKMSQEIITLQGQTHQLSRTIRDDFTDAASSAFVEFANGTKSAGDAFHDFVNDINNRLLKMASDALFQKIFGNVFGDDSGITKLIDGIGGKGSQITTAIAEGGTAAAGEITAGMTSGATIAGQIIAAAMAAGGAGGGGIGGLGSVLQDVAGPGSGDAFGSYLYSLAGITGLAGGGPVDAGTPYIVGENGPELMVPSTDGRIVPDGWRGGGVNVVNHFHIQAPKGTVSRATQSQIAAQVAMSTAAASSRNN